MRPYKTKKQLKAGARFFLDQKINRSDPLIELPREIVKHATSALRLKKGALVSLFDGDGGEYLAKLVSVLDGEVRAEILQFLDSEADSKLRIALTQSILSNEKMNLIIQKSTELGIAEINIFRAERSSIKVETDQLEKRKHHWHKVAIAACEQSGRTKLPKIKVYPSLTHLIETAPNENAKQTGLILSPSGSANLKDLDLKPCNINIAIGPEGGFSDEEITIAKSNGFIDVKLGPRTLRAETAGISMTAIAQALWGDF